MRTIKLKIFNGLTLAHPQAPLGKTPSGAAIYEVTNVPDGITNVQVVLHYRGYWKPIFNKGLSVQYPGY